MEVVPSGQIPFPSPPHVSCQNRRKKFLKIEPGSRNCRPNDPCTVEIYSLDLTLGGKEKAKQKTKTKQNKKKEKNEEKRDGKSSDHDARKKKQKQKKLEKAAILRPRSRLLMGGDLEDERSFNLF